MIFANYQESVVVEVEALSYWVGREAPKLTNFLANVGNLNFEWYAVFSREEVIGHVGMFLALEPRDLLRFAAL